MKNNVGERFSEFFDKWVRQNNDYLQKLLLQSPSSSSAAAVLVSEQDLQNLVSEVAQHFKEYYTVKWALAREDVLPFFSPVWVSPLENAHSWITGWKPSTIFKVIDSLRATRFLGGDLAGLTREQLDKIEGLRVRIRSEEEKVEREMERQQVALADRKMLELARLSSRVGKGDAASGRVEGLVEVALKSLMAGLEKVMKAADCVRLRTLKGVLDVLGPLQSVEFLAGTSMVLFQLRGNGEKLALINSS